METSAHSNIAADGIGAVIEVASPNMRQRLPVAGRLPDEGVQLRLPTLPPTATNVSINLRAGRGLDSLASNWSGGLRDYPHRCREQILSRAVGAAAAIRLGIADTQWPDARRVVDEALRVAGQFQDTGGEFHFFAGQNGWEVTHPSLMLTTYTVQAFAFLRSMGYEVPAIVEQKARDALADELDSKPNWRETEKTTYRNEALTAAAAVVAPRIPAPPATLVGLWAIRDQLGWHGRANLARALSHRTGFEEKSRSLVDAMRVAGTKRGMARSIEDKTRSIWPLQSRWLDQCAVLSALRELDTSLDARSLRAEYLRGLADLYAGGAAVLDTQASAQCLMVLVELEAEIADPEDSLEIEVSAGATATAIKLEPGRSAGERSRTFVALPARLDLRANAAYEGLKSFVASVEYDLDGRRASPVAVGFSLERQYSVVRERAWKDATTTQIHEGEWVRVNLTLTTSSLRRFMAISDSVPGGLRPTDLELSGVADAELLGLQTFSSPWFPARQVDDRIARFYSEQLPPGRHEIHYYTRATSAGHYAALPAVAELMYGNASVSRTEAATVEIGPAATGPSH